MSRAAEAYEAFQKLKREAEEQADHKHKSLELKQIKIPPRPGTMNRKERRAAAAMARRR
jgi:hypothetical protein